MKYTLLTCALLTLLCGKTIAQLPKAEFMSKVNAYANAKLTEKGDKLNELSGMMKKQMDWLNGDIAGRYNKEKADDADATNRLVQAKAAKAQADKDIAQAEKELQQGNSSKAQTDIQNAQKEVNQAAADDHRAHQDKEKAQLQLHNIDKDKIKLITEQTSYNNIQSMKKDIAHNENKIMEDLKAFASTLN